MDSPIPLSFLFLFFFTLFIHPSISNSPSISLSSTSLTKSNNSVTIKWSPQPKHLLSETDEFQFDQGHSPDQIHLALTGEEGEMRVMFVSGHGKESVVRYGLGPGQMDQTAEARVGRYEREDMCDSPANSSVGWRDPGFIHDGVMINLEPGRRYFYKVMAPNRPQSEEIPSICRDTLTEYSDHIMKLGLNLLELFSEGHYYPTCPEPELTLGTNCHTDAYAYVEGDKYYGAKATMNVWEPKIQQSNEFSLSQIWILGGSFGQDLNSIEAGWQVSPDLYGDNNTRLFTYSTVRLEGQTPFCWLCEQPQKLLVPFEMRGYQGVYNLEKRENSMSSSSSRRNCNNLGSPNW